MFPLRLPAYDLQQLLWGYYRSGWEELDFDLPFPTVARFVNVVLLQFERYPAFSVESAISVLGNTSSSRAGIPGRGSADHVAPRRTRPAPSNLEPAQFYSDIDHAQ